MEKWTLRMKRKNPPMFFKSNLCFNPRLPLRVMEAPPDLLRRMLRLVLHPCHRPRHFPLHGSAALAVQLVSVAAVAFDVVDKGAPAETLAGRAVSRIRGLQVLTAAAMVGVVPRCGAIVAESAVAVAIIIVGTVITVVAVVAASPTFQTDKAFSVVRVVDRLQYLHNLTDIDIL